MEPDRAQGHLPYPDQPTAEPGAVVAPWETELDPDVEALRAAAVGDPMERICPYLRSADGIWRADRPDLDHRCTSQSPAAPLPLLAQERFCLTSAHVRCEWFRHAQAQHSATLDREGIPRERILAARFRPAVRSVPLVLDALLERSDKKSGGRGGLTGRMSLAVGLAVVVLLSVGALVVLVAGQGVPTVTPPPVAVSPTPAAGSPGSSPSPAGTPSPDRSPTPGTASPTPTSRLVYYEVKEGESLKTIAERFGIRRNRIAAVNDLGDPPRVDTGQVIALPLSPDATLPPDTFLQPEVP